MTLLHGFTSSVEQNWTDRSWIELLIAAGRQVIAVDLPVLVGVAGRDEYMRETSGSSSCFRGLKSSLCRTPRTR